ncbi:DNA/RNA helicase domain-containing protein [Algiphilus sp.]|uniref:DNA/RNA helicase domain-containing protein n=1 Tax=Algiphilus sp. TaxID=1872431 RepID=UPI0025C5C4D3|nr:DNA/RNA helicase domain-containing protein [Algiphilus sp.]MCK5771062.1 DUF2075 domain-containing protein [Algiphilus sp.]
MFIYTADKQEFVAHVCDNVIEERILEGMRSQGLGGVGASEVRSWQNSLLYMKNVVDDDAIPNDAGVAIEYKIPQTAKRIDFILSGYGDKRQHNAVIVELKQWDRIATSEKDGIVRTAVGGGEREMLHPSYQAWTYAALLSDFNESVESENIALWPCAYLHNCSADEVRDKIYAQHLQRAPVFLRADSDKLRRFISQHVRRGDQKQTLYLIDTGRIRPSKSLADHLAALMQGKREFLMIDDQKLIYEQALAASDAAETEGKQVLIVEGGPGTGKTVVAVNLLVELTQRERNAHYVTRNAAPRRVYESKLTGTPNATRIRNLFKSSGSYHGTDADALDALIIDEAHRLNEKSGMFQNLGENQIKELIAAARLSVFFIDEDQRVTWRDIGSRAEINRWADELGATVHRAELQSQFRCNGSDGYLAWIDNALQIRSTANTDSSETGYHVEVVDSPTELRRKVLNHNIEANRARLLAGYCWDWKSKREPDAMDIVFPEHDFAMQWNLDKDGPLWLVQPNSVHQIGCIHTCQGLELDYAGVIIGPDLIVREGKILTVPTERSHMDSSIRGYRTARRNNAAEADGKAEAIIKNTYRTLLSRATKGCFIWCTDQETLEYFRALTAGTADNRDVVSGEVLSDPACPLDLLPANDVEPYVNAVPLMDFKAAAGGFSEIQSVEECQWVMLPDHLRPSRGMFVAQVIGDSMNRVIPNGAWCLFQGAPEGSRQGKIVLVQHRSIEDPDTGASFTVKRYRSEKATDDDGDWRHTRIALLPDSLDPQYQPIELDPDLGDEIRVVGEYKCVVHY